MNKKWQDLDDNTKSIYYEKAIEFVDDTLMCTRVWEAWVYNTMTKDDFVHTTDCDDRVFEIAEVLYNFVQSQIKEEKK